MEHDAIDLSGFHDVIKHWNDKYGHDTFEPVKARSYELPSICPVESTGIVRFLMGIEDPSSEVAEAIEAAVTWISQSKLTGIRVETIKTAPVRFEFHTTTHDRIVVSDPDAPPIWTRYYEIATNRPFFCNRDRTKVYSLADVHLERRTGYSWYTSAPRHMIEVDFPAWQAMMKQPSEARSRGR